ncbi:hypothetical protein B0J13DRAFT_512892 [Dactylonectria estremocensis]|uniref:DUF1996 domain-containing protein n=1 Tax=Dactylonectria estremocensis TaxID=1079267 RepID=A0A9P9DK07_9HYPO|nr:hypothetical protein B0J13DRAFT_512892 [Dactylonectria estremocensis]
MPSFTNILATGLMAQAAQAYTVINLMQPIFYKNIDPIVFPGSYTESHLHSFFGSDAVTANTNSSAELQAGCTNAQNPNDLSVYWVPTLLYTTDSGSTYEPVPMFRFSAYYNLGETPAEVAIPQNLKMLAGDASNQVASGLAAAAKIEWFCEGDSVETDDTGFPVSTCSTHLQTILFFPQCVNTATLEVAYKDRSYGTTNWCPEGMQSMPQLRFSIRYDLRKALPNGWSGGAPLKLACGNAYCSHGDFINGWTEEAAENMVATTELKYDFLAVDGALGSNGEQPSCTPTDSEPTLGTSDYAESVSLMSKRAVTAAGWSSRNRLARA